MARLGECLTESPSVVLLMTAVKLITYDANENKCRYYHRKSKCIFLSIADLIIAVAMIAPETVGTIAVFEASCAFFLFAEASPAHVPVLTKFILAALEVAVMARTIFVVNTIMVVVAIAREVDAKQLRV